MIYLQIVFCRIMISNIVKMHIYFSKYRYTAAYPRSLEEPRQFKKSIVIQDEGKGEPEPESVVLTSMNPIHIILKMRINCNLISVRTSSELPIKYRLRTNFQLLIINRNISRAWNDYQTLAEKNYSSYEKRSLNSTSI